MPNDSDDRRTEKETLRCRRHLKQKKLLSTREFRNPCASSHSSFQIIQTSFQNYTSTLGLLLLCCHDGQSFQIHSICSPHMHTSSKPLEGHSTPDCFTLSVTNSCVLFALDVESVYTNVPIPEGLEAVAKQLVAFPDPSKPYVPQT